MGEEKSKLPPVEIRALRGKEAGTFERLLCQLLITANNSPPLVKIRKMCEAVFRANSMMPQSPANKINMDEVEVIHTVVTTLLSANFHALANPFGRYVKILWPFDYTSENYERFIKPWRKTVAGLEYYPYIGGGNFTQIEDRNKEVNSFIDSLDESGRFFTLTVGVLASGGLLHESGYYNLENQFVTWALPKVEEWYLELTKLVEPSLFDEIFRTMYMGEKKPEKEEK